jgi:hypothetical protein
VFACECRLAASSDDDVALSLLRAPLVSAFLATGRMKKAPAVAEANRECSGEDRARPCPFKANWSSPIHVGKETHDDRTDSSF